MKKICIRKARETDLDFAFDRTVEAGRGSVEELMGCGSKSFAKDVFSRLWTGNVNRFHYENCVIAESDGKKLGFLSYYTAAKKPYGDLGLFDMLRAGGKRIASYYLFRPLLAIQSLRMPEGKAGELYISALALSPDARGRGIGTQMIRYVFQEAKAAGLSKVSLIVAEDNRSAKRLYEKLGFLVQKPIRKPKPGFRMLAVLSV